MRKDKQATIDTQFLDQDSYIAPDGRDVLHGSDWKARVEDLRLRSGGRCEQGKDHGGGDLFRCASRAQDPDHVMKRSTKRDDRLANLQALCRFHHDLKHPEHRIRSDKKERATCQS
jgi:hypothetical protein